ncbi:MAG: ATP-binding protein [Clostridium sp.]|nr:ATP-binding protein [Clostridium sp.]
MEELIYGMLEYWSLLIFVQVILKLPLVRSKKQVAFVCMLPIPFMIIFERLLLDFDFGIGVLLFEMIAIMWLFGGRCRERLFAIYISYLCFSIISGWIKGTAVLFTDNVNGIMGYSAVSVFVQIVSCMSFGGLSLLYGKYQIPERASGDGRREWYSIPVFLMVTATCIASNLGTAMLIADGHVEEGDLQQVFMVLSMLVGFVVMLLAVLLWLSRQRKQILQRDNFQKEQYIQVREQQYHMMEESEKAMRTFKHDMEEHLDCVHTLLEKGCVSEAQQYIKKMIQIKDYKLSCLFKSGNLYMDVLLSKLYQRLQEMQVLLEVKGDFPQKFSMEAYDMTALFGNLFRNAAEAVEQMPAGQERYVRIGFYVEGSYFVSIIENTYLHTLRQDKKGNYLTTKEHNKKNHGYGIENAKEIVGRYHGEIWISAEDGHFKAEVLLPAMKD